MAMAERQRHGLFGQPSELFNHSNATAELAACDGAPPIITYKGDLSLASAAFDRLHDAHARLDAIAANGTYAGLVQGVAPLKPHRALRRSACYGQKRGIRRERASATARTSTCTRSH